MRTLDRRLLRTILGAKAQYGAVVIIICIGLAAWISISSTAENMSTALAEYYSQHQFADLFADFTQVPVNTIDDLAKYKEVEMVEARIITDIRADVGREFYPTLRLVSIRHEQEINRLYVQAGRIPATAGERGIALLNVFARENNIAVGDKIDLIIRGELFPVTVTALVDSPEYIYAIKDIKGMLPDNLNFGIGFINLPLLQELMAMPGQANNAVITLRPGVDERALLEEIKEDFKGRGLKSMITKEDQVSHALIELEIQQLQRVSKAVPAMFLGIASLVIYMLISRLVRADRISIGILKATGYSNFELMEHYLKLALILGIVGAIGGITGGYILAGLMTQLMLDYFHLPLMEINLYFGFVFVGLVSALLFCGLSGIWAARGVIGIAPAEAMRPKAQLLGKKSLVEKWAPAVWTRCTFSWKLVLRGISRNRRRFVLATAGVALTYALILFSVYMFSIWNIVVDQQFGRLETYDYAISFLEPVGSDATVDLRRQVHAPIIEPFLELPFELTYGWHRQSVLARALPRTSQLYCFEDQEGNLVSLPSRGVLLSQGLANSLGVKRGSVVELSSYITGGQSYLVPVTAVVAQYLGSGLYLSLKQMERLTGQKGTFTGVVLTSSDDVKGMFQNMANIESICSRTDLADTFSEYMGVIITSASFMICLGGLLGFSILYNTTSVSIAEREREFSSLRVLGYFKPEIFRLIIRENAIATAAGLIIGAPLGKGIVVIMMNAVTGSTPELFYFPATIKPSAYFIAAGLVIGFMILTLLAIGRKVNRLDFLQALSSRLN
ncbi:MAG: ABC transporter permease [Firmicutes bacterium]|nr:ABC transporter permease [Bacillota bacterium]